MPTTPDLGIPELAQSQANPDITHNEALVLLQALNNGVIDRAINTPPGSPTEGDSYIVGVSPNGAWTGRANCIATYWGGAWRFIPGNDDSGTPITMGARQEGINVWVRDEDARYTWNGSTWTVLVGPIDAVNVGYAAWNSPGPNNVQDALDGLYAGNEATYPATIYNSIQDAIDAAYAAGGGHVVVSVSASENITLRSNVYVRIMPGVTLSYVPGSPDGNLVSSPGNDILYNAGIIGRGGFLDAGTDGVKALEVVSAWGCIFDGFTVLGDSVSSFGIDVRGDATGGSNPVGGRHSAYNTFSNILHEGDCGTFIRLDGTTTNSGFVTLNNFHNMDAENVHVVGIDQSQWCDNNFFDGNTRVSLVANSAVGVDVNTASPTANVGVYSNIFTSLAVDTFGTMTGRIGIRLNWCQDIHVWHFFQDPPAEGGSVVLSADARMYSIRHYNIPAQRIDHYIDGVNTIGNVDATEVYENGVRVLTQANNGVSNAMLRDSAAVSVIGRSANSTGDPADIAALANDRILRRVADALDFGQLTDGMVPTNTLSLSKLVNASAQYNIIMRTSSGAGAWEQKATSALINTILGRSAAADIRSDIVAARTDGANTFTGRQTVNVDNDYPVVMQRTNDGAAGPKLATLHNSTSPAFGDIIGGFEMNGKDDAGNDHTYGAFYTLILDPVNGSEDGRFQVNTSAAGTSGARQFWNVGSWMNGATGGDQGAGTFNATAVYDDGVLLCAPLHPEMSLADWDAIVPDRIIPANILPVSKPTGRMIPAKVERRFVNGPGKWWQKLLGRKVRGEWQDVEVEPERPEMTTELVEVEPERRITRRHRTAKRHFAMLAEGFNPNDADSYVARLLADKALPGMPTLSEWTERMVTDGIKDKMSLAERNERLQLAVDYLSVAFADVVGRLQKLEAANGDRPVDNGSRDR